MYELIDREDVLRIIKMHGALQPLEVKRKLGKGETTMIGAVLSELAHHHKVAISKLKRGTSPFYYDPNNPAVLEKVAQYLGEKDKRTFDLLQAKKVIDPAVVDPLTRVSLGNIVDYSIKFTHNDKEFYRYYLTPEAEAKELLEKPRAKPVPKPFPQTPSTPLHKPIPSEKRVPKKNSSRPAKKIASVQKTLKKTSNVVAVDDEFLKRVVRYCNNKGLVIESQEVVRKKREIDLVLRIPTGVGKVSYFCKAKSKKKSNDGDVAGALLAAQRRQLPALYLTTGEVTKKAKEMPELKGVLIKEIKP